MTSESLSEGAGECDRENSSNFVLLVPKSALLDTAQQVVSSRAIVIEAFRALVLQVS